VGLVNIGVEETKGTELQVEAYGLMKEAGYNFIGNVEAREVPLGELVSAVIEQTGLVAHHEKEKGEKGQARVENLRLVERDLRGTAGIFDVDISKIVVSVRGSGLTGEMLSQILRDKYHLEMEMCGADYVTAIAAIGDSKKGLKRLKKALLEIDKELEKNGNICNDDPDENVYSRHAKQVMPVFKAMDGEKEAVPLKESCGRICGEFAYIYPPGIPLLAPGEQITEEILKTLQDYIEKDLPVQGLEDTDLVTIQVMALSGGRSV
jgi:arginine/lysine/ornithine decarboxylase